MWGAGWQRRLVTIKRATITKDTTYQTPIETFASISGNEQLWAWVRDAQPSRQESVRNGLQQARRQTVMRLRWRNDLTPDMRITVHAASDVDYEIVGGPAEFGGRQKWLELVLEHYQTSGV